MLLKMERSQMTAIGQLMRNVAYTFDMSNEAHKRVAEHLLEKKFAKKTTQQALDKEAEDLAERQRADLAAVSHGKVVAPALTEMAKEAAQKVLEDAAAEAQKNAQQVMADATAAAEREAKKILADAQKEAARIKADAAK